MLQGYRREARVRAGIWNARVLLRELHARNYSGGDTLLTDGLRPKREAAQMIAVSEVRAMWVSR
jgi:hypothetical protein